MPRTRECKSRRIFCECPIFTSDDFRREQQHARRRTEPSVRVRFSTGPRPPRDLYNCSYGTTAVLRSIVILPLPIFVYDDNEKVQNPKRFCVRTTYAWRRHRYDALRETIERYTRYSSRNVIENDHCQPPPTI